jgi:hypothetical protein
MRVDIFERLGVVRHVQFHAEAILAASDEQDAVDPFFGPVHFLYVNYAIRSRRHGRDFEIPLRIEYSNANIPCAIRSGA